MNWIAGRVSVVVACLSKVKAQPFLVLLGCVAAIAQSVPSAAQNQENSYAGGSRLAPRAAQITQSGPAAARFVLQKFAQCLYARRGNATERFLALPVDTREFATLQRTLFDSVGDSCLEGDGTLRASDDLLRGALFEAAYRKKFGNSRPVRLDGSSATGGTAVYAQPFSEAARREIMMQDIAGCTVRADWNSARSLIMSYPETTRENMAFSAITAKLRPCLASGQKAEFSKPALRAVLAEGLYRMSVAASATAR